MTKQISHAARALAIGVVAALVLINVAVAQTPRYFLDDAADKDNTALYYIEGWHDYDVISWNSNGYYHTAASNWGGWYFVNDAYKPTTSEYYIEARVRQNFEFFSVFFNIIPSDYNSFTSRDWYEVRYHTNGDIVLYKFSQRNQYKKNDFVCGGPPCSGNADTIANAKWNSDKNWHNLKIFYNENSGEVKVWLDDIIKIQAKVSGLTPTKNIAFFTYTDGPENSGGDYVDFDDLKIYSLDTSPQHTQSTQGVISKTGLVAEYHFDGDAKDSSGNGNDGTINGATFVQGVSGQALSFDGSNNYVNIGDPVSGVLDFGATNSFTLAAFFNSNTFSGKTRSIIQKWTTPPNKGYYLRFQIEDGNLRFHILDESDGGTNPMVTYATSNFATGTWYYVVAVRDIVANKLRLYVNGVEVASVTSTSKATSNSGDLYIGSYNGIDNFNGLIDEVQIYNRALSAEEIKANYDSIIGKSPATTATKPASAPTSSPATPAPTIAQTAIPTPAPTAAPESSNSYVYAGIGGIILLLVAIVALKRRISSKVEEPFKREPAVKPEPQKPAPVTEPPKSKPAPVTVPEAPGVYVKTAFGYKGAAIIYKLKIENNTSDPISDIKVYPYVPDVFLLRDKEKSIALIEPKSSQTVTFEIRPTGECGDCNVSGRVNYYDMESRKRQDIEIEQKSLSIVCPMLHGKEITETEWYDAVGNLVKTEESTREIGMPADSLFTMVTRVIKDMHMHMQKPEVTKNHKLFNGVARFYGEGVKGLKYAAQVEVVGGAKKSKLILKVWAEKEDALTGFYHGILDEIEKRVNVKEYIDDSIVQYNIHYGDKIGTLVKDSVVQRSTIGASSRKCPDCGREVEANEKFCLECGAKL